jgi:hypothetical protein
MKKAPAYKPLSRLVDLVNACLAACCAAELGVAWAHLNEAAGFDRLFGGTETIGGANYTSDLSLVAARLFLATYVVAAVVFIAWFRRCYRNLLALGVPLPYASHETVWAWIVPIASLFRPAQIARAMWRAARPHEGDGTVTRWWGLFIASNVLTVVANGIGSTNGSTSNQAGAHRLLAVTSLLSLAAAVAAMVLVRQLTAAIESRRPAAAPPAPVPA